MSTSLSSLSWLPEDLTGKALTNYVENEVHKSETTGALSRFIIIPAQGAFYDTDNLQVVYHTQTSDTVLVRDNDYRLVGVDYGRTKISSAKGGVYNFILITTVFNYDPTSYITISYQAFGGYMSAAAYSALSGIVMDIQAKLNNDGIITADNIASNTTIQTIVNSLQALCSRLQYAPTTKYVMHTSVNNTVEWHTIAVSTDAYNSTLDFTDDSTLHGTFVLNVDSQEFNLKAALNYDLALSDPGVAEVHNGKVDVDVIHQSMAELNVEAGANDTAYFVNGMMLIPKFRVVSVSDTGAAKVYIQMALISNVSRDITLYLTDSTELTMADVSNKYVLTSDTTFESGKTYYTRTGTDNYYKYTAASVTVGDTVPADTYYELVDVEALSDASLMSKFTICSKTSTVVPPEITGTNINYSNAVNAIKDKFKIWDGNVNLTFVENMSWLPKTTTDEYGEYDELTPIMSPNGYPALPYCPGKCLEPYTINWFICEIYDRWEQELISVKFQAKPKNPFRISTTPPDTIVGQACYFNSDNCVIHLSLTLSTTTRVLNVHASSGKSSRVNERFDLRRVYIA